MQMSLLTRPNLVSIPVDVLINHYIISGVDARQPEPEYETHSMCRNNRKEVFYFSS